MTGVLSALGIVCLSASAEAASLWPVLQVSPVDSRYLADADGKTFVPIGCNVCFDRLNADGRDAERTRERFERWMRAFAANGGNFMRVWLGHPSTEIMPERPGVFDPEGEKTLRLVVSFAEELGVKPQWAGFFWWKWDETQKRDHFDPDPAKDRGFRIYGKPACDVLRRWSGRG